jgi:hypothetical protein
MRNVLTIYRFLQNNDILVIEDRTFNNLQNLEFLVGVPFYDDIYVGGLICQQVV